MKYFADRKEAGQLLAENLKEYSGRDDVIVLGLTSGGIPVAFEISSRLKFSFDVVVVRKLRSVRHYELALGAISSGDIVVFNEEIINSFDIPQQEIDKVVEHEREELNRWENFFMIKDFFPDLNGKTVILADDGIVTGAAMRAAIGTVNIQNAAKIIIAVPVGENDVIKMLHDYTDDIVCLITSSRFWSIDQWYIDFSRPTDEEIKFHLQKSSKNIKPKLVK